MNITLAKKTFPCYRNDSGEIIFSEKNIPAYTSEVERKKVYRICKYGVVDRDAFECSYESDLKRNTTIRQVEIKLTSEYFATSCFANSQDLRLKRVRYLLSKNPKAIIAIGDIKSDSGVSYMDRDVSETKSSHINWWIYNEANPQDDFEEVEI